MQESHFGLGRLVSASVSYFVARSFSSDIQLGTKKGLQPLKYVSNTRKSSLA